MPRKQKSKSRKKKASQQRSNARHQMEKLTRPVRKKAPPGAVRRALKMWKRNEWEKGIEQFERALRLRPNDADIMLDLGRAYGMRYQYDRAAELIGDALKRSPQNARRWLAAGESYRMFAQFDVAEEYFRKAVGLSPSPLEAGIALAEVHERLHRLEDASGSIDRVLARDPKNPAALFLEAKIARRQGETGKAEDLLRAQLNMPARDFDAHWRACYELANLFDRQGRYEEAMEAYLRAKKFVTKHAKGISPQRDYAQLKHRELFQQIGAADFDRWGPWSDSLGPEQNMALLCGHPRSGTTLVEQVLDSHPGLVSADETSIMSDDVYMAFVREFEEEGEDDLPTLDLLNRASNAQLNKARTNYRNHTEAFLREPIGDRILMDKNPELSAILPVILRFFPECRVVFALRDPRDVCLSCFMQPLPMNSVSVNYLDIESTFRKYAATMEAWLKLRDMLPSPWMETRYEDNVRDLETESSRILEFLDLPWDQSVLQFHEHARQKHVRSPTYEAVTQPVYSHAVGRWKHYAEFLNPHLEILDPFVRAFGYD